MSHALRGPMSCSCFSRALRGGPGRTLCRGWAFSSLSAPLRHVRQHHEDIRFCLRRCPLVGCTRRATGWFSPMGGWTGPSKQITRCRLACRSISRLAVCRYPHSASCAGSSAAAAKWPMVLHRPCLLYSDLWMVHGGTRGRAPGLGCSASMQGHAGGCLAGACVLRASCCGRSLIAHSRGLQVHPHTQRSWLHSLQSIKHVKSWWQLPH